MKTRSAKKNKTTKEQCSFPSDRISELPGSIVQIILMFLSLRDMVRTCILSKHWRYQWSSVPQLVFKDDRNYFASRQERYKYNAMTVFEILLHHRGPIWMFTLDMNGWPDRSVIDRIIPFLSRNGIKELTLLMPYGTDYKMSCSILSCVELRHLSLHSCVFRPLTFSRFSKLINLELWYVRLDSVLSISSCPLLERLTLVSPSSCCFRIDAPNLKFLFLQSYDSSISHINTPHLEVLSLMVSHIGNWVASKFNPVEFFRSVPLLKDLRINMRDAKFHEIGCSSGFPAVLNNLKELEVTDICMESNEIPSILWLTRNSPNLQKLQITIMNSEEICTEWKGYLKNQQVSDYSLLKLREVNIELGYRWSEMRQFMELFMFLLDVSSALKILSIHPYLNRSIDKNDYMTMVDLACYPRAAPNARIVYDGLDSCEPE